MAEAAGNAAAESVRRWAGQGEGGAEAGTDGDSPATPSPDGRAGQVNGTEQQAGAPGTDGDLDSSTRLRDEDVEGLLGRFEELLGRVERVPGPTVEAAMAAIQTLAELYGEALARIVDLGDPALIARLAGDELVGHLLLLHGLHPEPVEQRIGRALADVQPFLGENGEAELTGIDAGVARIRVAASGCGSGEAAGSVADVVLAEAPELASVRPESQRPPTMIPTESLLHRPDAAP